MSDPEIIIDMLGGNCPVQAEGTVNGVSFYFRARGERWSMEIGEGAGDRDVAWEYTEHYGETPYAAGWMEPNEARAFIEKAAKMYAEAQT